MTKDNDVQEVGKTVTSEGETPQATPGETPQVATTVAEEWRGNPKYFQNGIKAGQLKPRYRDGATAKDAPAKQAGGLDIEKLRATASSAPAEGGQGENRTEAKGKPSKAEKKLVEAKTGAKLVMRMLDTITGWISGGKFGADFTEAQRKERNVYREELEQDWVDYLQTLDIPLHPGIVVLFGSMTYVAPAFETPKGQERVKTWKEKLIGKVVSKVIGG